MKQARPRAAKWLGSLLRRLRRDEAGAELVQLALVIPIVVGLVWFSFEAYQIVALRSTLRETVSQVSRYLTAFAAPSDEIIDNPNTLTPDEVCQGIQTLVGSSLANSRGNLGDAVSWEVLFYRVNDTMVSNWEGNLIPLDCWQLANTLQCNEQFAVSLRAWVPWRKVLLNLGGASATDMMLDLSDIAVGTAPCLPYLNVRGEARLLSEGPGGCVAEVCWLFEGSFVPERLEIYRGGEDYPVHAVNNPLSGGCATIPLPTGRQTTLTIRAIAGLREEEITLPPIGCMTGEPDVTPTP
jgi:Flp pilus assembly protein TadG